MPMRTRVTGPREFRWSGGRKEARALTSGPPAWMVRAAALLAILCLASHDARADDAARRTYAIAPQSVSAALRQFATQSHMQLIFSESDVEHARTGGVKGNLPPGEALTEILRGTGLEFELTPNHVIVVRRAEVTHAVSRPSRPPGAKAARTDSFRMAQVGGSPTAGADAMTNGRVDQVASAGSAQLDEVIVTAQKREERLQDVPIPMTALNAQALAGNNQFRLADYFSSVPGLNLQPNSSSGAPMLSIRGITTGYRSNPSVAVTVDDVPIGSSTYIGGGALSPDIDPSDLAQIEVLRGPQGALYGASSLGGLIKYETLDPSLTKASAQVSAGLATIENGSEPGYNVRAAANVPVDATLAARFSAFTRLDPGYIDNVETGERGVNWGNSYGGHVAALWRLSPAFSIKLGALIQNTETHGADVVQLDTGLRDLQQSFLRGTGGYVQKLQLYTAEVKARLAGVDIAAISGYNQHTNDSSYDVSALYGSLASKLTGFGGVPYLNPLRTKKFTQEVRLSAALGAKFDWLTGLFYTRESSTYSTDLGVVNPGTGATLGELIDYFDPTTYTEYAGFADLTYHFTDRLDVQVGGRESEIRQTNREETTTGLLGASSTPAYNSSNSAFTYLFTPRFHPSSNSMVYVRIASGYRPGGPNANWQFLRVPAQYDPDSTTNYDLGFKAYYPARALSLDVALYYIDWRNVQVTMTAPNSTGKYIANGGGARSRGLELSVKYRPVRGLTLSPWIAFNDAALTKNLPPVGLPGDRLPFSSRWSGNISLDQVIAATDRVSVSLGGVVSYFSDFIGDFGSTRLRQYYPGYARTDVHAGVDVGDSWSVRLYATNLMDRRAILFGGSDFTLGAPNSYILIQPRTVGVSFTTNLW